MTLPNIYGFCHCLTIIDLGDLKAYYYRISLMTLSYKQFLDIRFHGLELRKITTTDQSVNLNPQFSCPYLKTFETKKIRTTAYQPQSNGIIECWHKTLKTAVVFST